MCINQDDIPERNSQVPLMREIYSKATTTVVWVGASDQNYVSLTFARPFLHARGQMNHEDFVSHISRRVGELDLAKLYPNIPSSVFGPMVEQRLDAAVATRIGDCFNHTGAEDPSNYWARAWTAQEVAVSRNAILQSGDVTVSFKEIEEFSKYIWSAWANQDIVVKMGLRFYLTPPISPGRSPEPLPTVLAEQRHRHATDPRDNVYAFLGLSDLDLTQLEVHYEKSVREVYTETSVAVMNASSQLDILCSAILGNSDASHQLPSWVPDWSFKNSRSPVMPSDDSCAGGINSEFEFIRQDGFDFLSAVGLVYGHVLAVSPNLNWRRSSDNERTGSDASFLSILGPFVEHLAAALLELESRTSRSIPINVMETLRGGSLASSITVDRLIDLLVYKEARKNHRTEGLSAVDVEDISIPTSLDDEINLANVAFNLTCGQRVLFAFERAHTCLEKSVLEGIAPQPEVGEHSDGSSELDSVDIIYEQNKQLWSGDLALGMGQQEIRENDLVVILCGCSCPVVLRPEGKYYQFVASVYVEGITEGSEVLNIDGGHYPKEVFDLV